MDRFTRLPPELREEALLRLPPEELQRLCQQVQWPICSKESFWKKHNQIWGGYIPEQYLAAFDLWLVIITNRPTLELLEEIYVMGTYETTPEETRNLITTPIYPPIFRLRLTIGDGFSHVVTNTTPMSPLDIMDKIWSTFRHLSTGDQEYFFDGLRYLGNGEYLVVLTE